MTGIGWLFLMYVASKAKGAQRQGALARKPFTGKSGTTWFVVDATEGASKTPTRTVFATPEGNLLVLKFAVLPGGIRARMFVAPTTMAETAIRDFDVSQTKAGPL